MARGLKTGGRKKHTPNVITSEVKTWLSLLIDNNRSLLESDLKKLDSYQRWVIFEKILSYLIPKQQAVDIKTAKEAEYEALGKLIDTTPEQFIDEVTSRILKLREAEHE